MPDRLALVIAIDTYQEAGIPAAPHAESDAAALAALLARLGFARDRQIVLLGNQATKTAVESRLRRLVKSAPEGEALFVFFAGHGSALDGHAYLTCHDSQPDELAETSVPLGAVLEALRAARCQRVALFLDSRVGLPGAELSAFFGKAAGAVCLASCQEGEASHVSGSLKSGVWAHHLIEALAGKALLALENGQVVTAASLQAHLAREVPRTLRATFRDGREQTPTLFAAGKKRFILADVAGLLEAGSATADPRLQPLKRGALRVETTGKVRALSGFRKHHRLPDRVNPSSQKFVADLAAEDVKADVDSIYAQVREQMGYKRRDVEGSADRGSGFVRTPDFEYSVSVEQAPDDPTSVVWCREVASIRTPEVVLDRPFQAVFGGMFDTLVFEFVKPFDLEAWVDRMEEEMPEGVRLRTASDCSQCDVTVAGFGGVIRLRKDRVEVQGGQSATSKGLVEAFLQFQDLFATRRDLIALPLSAREDNDAKRN
jgi:hypothetical protein